MTDRTDEPVVAQDWRLVPAAMAVWLATMTGLLLGWWWAAAGGVAAVVAGLVVFARSRGRPARQRWWRLGVAWSLLVCGLLVGVGGTLRLREAAEDPLRPLATSGASGVFRVEVTERPRPVFSAGFGGQQSGVRSVLLPGRVRGAVVAGRAVDSSGAVLVLAPVDRWATLLPGQEVTTAAVLAPAKPGALTAAVLRVRGPPGDASQAAMWQRIAQTLRSGLRDASAVLDPEPAGLLPGLVVGDTDTLSRQVVAEFQTAGLSHLLAVSGANLAIVCVAVLLLLRAMRIGPRGSAAGAMLALIGFVILAGPEPSVLRAGVMGAVGLLALAVGRERAALPALGVAVVILVLWDPAMAVSVGFALSVLATGGLVLIAPRWADRLAARGVPRGVAEALAVPAAAHLVTAPVVAGMSGQVSVVAVVANLLAAPVVAPATVLGVLAALAAPVLPWLAELFVRIAGPEADWLIFVGRQAAGVPGAAIGWPSGWWGGLLLAGCALVLVAALRHRRLRVLVGVVLIGLLIVVIPVRVIAPGWPPPGWAMVACDVGQGDALVLATGEAGRAVVVDTGPEVGPVAACLDRLDVSRVPLVVLSHLHADHVGGLDAVLDDDRAVGAVGLSPARVPAWAWEEVRRKSERAGVPVVQLEAGRRLAWPGLSIEVLAPDATDVMPAEEAEGTEINNASLVLRAATTAGRVLLSGDVELSAQARLLGARVDLSADVVKVPHHGSRYTTPELFAAIRARIAVISVGSRNRYGHPSPLTLRALQGTGALVLRTDTGGDTAIVPSDAGPRAITRGPARAPPGRSLSAVLDLAGPVLGRTLASLVCVQEPAQSRHGCRPAQRAGRHPDRTCSVRQVHRDRRLGSTGGHDHRTVVCDGDAERAVEPAGGAQAATGLDDPAAADHPERPARHTAAGRRPAGAARLRPARDAPVHLQRAGDRRRTVICAAPRAAVAGPTGAQRSAGLPSVHIGRWCFGVRGVPARCGRRGRNRRHRARHDVGSGCAGLHAQPAVQSALTCLSRPMRRGPRRPTAARWPAGRSCPAPRPGSSDRRR